MCEDENDDDDVDVNTGKCFTLYLIIISCQDTLLIVYKLRRGRKYYRSITYVYDARRREKWDEKYPVVKAMRR
jgi:hypothetical protein